MLALPTWQLTRTPSLKDCFLIPLLQVLADNSDAPFEHRSRNGQVHGSSQAVEEGLDDGSADVYVHPFGREILQLIRDSSPSEARCPSSPFPVLSPWCFLSVASHVFVAIYNEMISTGVDLF